MGFSRRIAAGFAAPTAVLAASLAALGWLSRLPGFYADKLLLLLLAAGMVWALWARTRRTNLLIARFVATLDHADWTQTFRTVGRGAGLDELGAAFDAALARVRAQRLAGAAENRFAAALVDEAPTPLLAIDPAGIVHLANKAARRLFQEADRREIGAFLRYGRGFAEALGRALPGERLIRRVRWNGLDQRAVLAVSLADRQGAPWRIVSVQIIQNELDAAEMATQADLVRVLTHEIMNSLTPITSLAETARRLLATAEGQDPAAREDARLAVGALADRAAAISRFVQSYRSFSESPSIAARRFAAAPWLRALGRAFAATPAAWGVGIEIDVDPEHLMIEGDAGLLGQVVLNLLKNAGEAARTRPSPRVTGRLSGSDAGRPLLRISDNGPGVPPHLEKDIFLPFFTTKAQGSGVGLSFAKQIVLLHGGSIGLAEPELGGTTIQIVL